MFNRLLPAIGVVGVLTVVVAGSAAAGGGGGYGGPGVFHFSDTSVNASFYDLPSDTYTNVYVDRGQQSFKAKRTPGAPVTEITGTVLNINTYSPSAGTGSFGCWIIPDKDFAVAGDLSSATVNALATDEQPCPGYYFGSATGGKPGLQSSIGYGGGGPGTGMPPTPVNLSLAGTGAVWTNTNNSTDRCQGFSAVSHNTFDYEYATASGSVGGSSGQDQFAQIGQSTSMDNATGTPSAACNPPGF